MADCIDAQIDANLVTTLKTITTGNGYNTNIGTVERIRSIQSIGDRYPYTLVVEMEPTDNEEFGFRDDTLNYILWYFDGVNDKSETENTEFVYRLRNVHADIIKALKIDPSRGGLAQNTQIPRHGYGVFFDDAMSEPGAWVAVEIERLIDANNPYLLA